MRKTPALALLPALWLSVPGALAESVTESEANNTVATANAVAGGTQLLSGSIGGTLGGFGQPPAENDEDLFRFNLGAGTSFTADMLSNDFDSEAPLDLSLVLLNSSLQSVAGNDGTNGSLFYDVSTAGTYYLGVSAFQNEALDEFGNFLRDPFWFEALPLAGWLNQSFARGDYTLSVVSAVPLPAAAWLLAVPLAGFFAWGRRRGRAAA